MPSLRLSAQPHVMHDRQLPPSDRYAARVTLFPYMAEESLEEAYHHLHTTLGDPSAYHWRPTTPAALTLTALPQPPHQQPAPSHHLLARLAALVGEPPVAVPLQDGTGQVSDEAAPTGELPCDDWEAALPAACVTSLAPEVDCEFCLERQNWRARLRTLCLDRGYRVAVDVRHRRAAAPVAARYAVWDAAGRGVVLGARSSGAAGLRKTLTWLAFRVWVCLQDSPDDGYFRVANGDLEAEDCLRDLQAEVAQQFLEAQEPFAAAWAAERAGLAPPEVAVAEYTAAAAPPSRWAVVRAPDKDVAAERRTAWWRQLRLDRRHRRRERQRVARGFHPPKKPPTGHVPLKVLTLRRRRRRYRQRRRQRLRQERALARAEAEVEALRA
eukprot:EG_transcript_15169